MFSEYHSRQNDFFTTLSFNSSGNWFPFSSYNSEIYLLLVSTYFMTRHPIPYYPCTQISPIPLFPLYPYSLYTLFPIYPYSHIPITDNYSKNSVYNIWNRVDFYINFYASCSKAYSISYLKKMAHELHMIIVIRFKQKS